MTQPWKIEYAVIDKGGNVLAYMDTPDGAKEYAYARKAYKVQKISHYGTEYEDVWYLDWENE